MKTAVAIRHVPFEDLGSFEEVLSGAGYAVRYLEAAWDDLSTLDRTPPELLVVLGGPVGANDEADYPFLRDERVLLERRLAGDRPTLGICLGAQLMVRALGARVYPAPRKEIGWSTLRLTEAGREGCLAPLAPEHTPVLHWHGDTFDLPEGAERLASTDVCPNQAFRYGHAALALQFHAEVTARGLEQWFIAHACEIGGTEGIGVERLRRDTRRWCSGLEVQGRRCLEEWLRVLPGE